MTVFQNTLAELRSAPRTWLITGVAGFIGSHLLEALLRIDQTVVGLDNFSTGTPRNLDAVRGNVSESQWKRFRFLEGSVASINSCREAMQGVDYVLHEAGFISVPLSIEDPVGCHDTNVTGTVNVLLAARDSGAKRVVYASSSAVYGDDTRMPKIESEIGNPLSPYGASKWIDEIYGRLFVNHYNLASIGLRYFNIFGPRQNPTGGYAAVIPQWITRLVRGEECTIHGSGEITRDFCHIANVVQANILAATSNEPKAIGEIYNVAFGIRTSLAELYELIARKVAALGVTKPGPVRYGLPRPGDIIHSGADTQKIHRDLGYAPEVDLEHGLEETVRWYAS